jgi:hypothetical protein
MTAAALRRTGTAIRNARSACHVQPCYSAPKWHQANATAAGIGRSLRRRSCKLRCERELCIGPVAVGGAFHHLDVLVVRASRATAQALQSTTCRQPAKHEPPWPHAEALPRCKGLRDSPLRAPPPPRQLHSPRTAHHAAACCVPACRAGQRVGGVGRGRLLGMATPTLGPTLQPSYRERVWQQSGIASRARARRGKGRGRGRGKGEWARKGDRGRGEEEGQGQGGWGRRGRGRQGKRVGAGRGRGKGERGRGRGGTELGEGGGEGRARRVHEGCRHVMSSPSWRSPCRGNAAMRCCLTQITWSEGGPALAVWTIGGSWGNCCSCARSALRLATASGATPAFPAAEHQHAGIKGVLGQDTLTLRSAAGRHSTRPELGKLIACIPRPQRVDVPRRRHVCLHAGSPRQPAPNLPHISRAASCD